VYGNGVWIACGDLDASEDTIWRSTDEGSTWTRATTFNGTNYIDGFAHVAEFVPWLGVAGAFIVGVGFTGTDKFLYSEDGDTWTRTNNTTLGLTTIPWITGLSFSDNIVVAGTNDPTNLAYWTVDGLSWNVLTVGAGINIAPSTNQIRNGAYGNGKFIITTSGTDSEYYESTDGKNLVLKTDMATSTSERYVAYSPTLDAFALSHINGGSAGNQMIYREENGATTTVVPMGVNTTDYYTFNGNTDARIRSFEDDIIYENNRYHTFAVNGAPKFVVADTVIQTTQPLLHGYMTTAARDALSVSEGTSIWNTTTKHLNIFDGTNWTVNNTYSEAGSWEDLVQYMGAGEKKASNPPTELQIGEFTLLEFDPSDQVTMHYHILHDYKLGSDAFVHVHWSPLRDAVAGDIGTTVVWTINYTIARGHHQGGVNNWATPTTLTLTHTFDGTELKHEHMITESVTGFDLLEADSILTISAKYDAGSTWVDAIVGLSCDLHYESTQETTTLRVPPFN
jgi:hypothetical protein